MLRSVLVNRGYFEAITYSFVDPKWQQIIDPEGKIIGKNLRGPSLEAKLKELFD